MEQRVLGRTGLRVSRVGFGAAPLGGVYGDIDEANGVATVRHAIDRGINFVDTSPYYGLTRSETVLGRALAGGYRERVVLCSKAGRNTRTDFDFTAAAVITSVEASLERLRTDALDVLIAHDIEFADDTERVFTETAEALHRLKRWGKCRFVGMSGYPVQLLARAVEFCDLDVVLTYCHCTLLNTTALTELVPEAAAHNVGLINGSPLAMGLLTQDGPPEWHPAPDVIKDHCRRAAALCAGRGADLARVALRYAASHDAFPTTLLGCKTRAQVDASLEAIDGPADEELTAELLRLLKPVHNTGWPSGRWGEK